jgi:hypothetical protein
VLRLPGRIINVAVVPLTGDDTTVNHGHQRNETERITKQNSQSYVWDFEVIGQTVPKRLYLPQKVRQRRESRRRQPKCPWQSPKTKITVKEFKEVSRRRSRRSEKAKPDVEKRRDPG